MSSTSGASLTAVERLRRIIDREGAYFILSIRADELLALREEAAAAAAARAEADLRRYDSHGRLLVGPEVEAIRAEADRLRGALYGLARKWAPHSGSCCTFDTDGKVIVTRESCACGPTERAAQEALDFFGSVPEMYKAIALDAGSAS